MEKTKFRFKYSPLVLTLIIVVIVIGLGGIALNVVNIVRGFDEQVLTSKIITTVLSSILDLTLIVIAVSALALGYYSVLEDCVICRFGLFRSKYKLNEIVAITEFTKTNKLVMYFEDRKFTVIVIAKEEYSQFIEALRNKNSSILANTNSDSAEK